MTEHTIVLQGRKVYVALPAYDGKLSVKMAIAMALFTEQAIKCGVIVRFGYVSGCSIVSRARNLLVAEFLKTDATDLLFIDSDINFEPNDALRLLAWASDRDIVAGIPRLKAKEMMFTVTLDKNPDESIIADELGLLKAKRVPTAFMMVKRRVFEKLYDEHPEWRHYDKIQKNTIASIFDFQTINGECLGEDTLFCDRAREHGFGVWVDPNIKLGHVGSYEYEGLYARDGLTTALPTVMSDVA